MEPNFSDRFVWSRLTALVTFGLLTLVMVSEGNQRSFGIDWVSNVFVKDGQPFKYVSGSMNYFRVPVEYWADRMVKLRSAGLNAVQTYIEWRSHEPSIGQYDFSGNLDIFKYLDLAAQNDLLVILRPGPYICAERDLGGLPSWLLTEDPSMKLRTMDPGYMDHVTRWFNHLLPRLKPYLYNNGGPVIMMQVENEYGSFPACDFEYKNYLRDLMANLTDNNVVLFTTDGYLAMYLKCGPINGTLATVDFGPGTDVDDAFKPLRAVQPVGPLVNSEYYAGWLDHWAEPHQVTSTDLVTSTLDQQLGRNISVNIYMFHGGTNFNLGSGSNYDSTLTPQPTSYDYDAPISESGDLTPKYWAIRSTISKYFPIADLPLPSNSKKMSLTVTSSRSINWPQLMQLGSTSRHPSPLTFESLGISTGFIVYSSSIIWTPSDPSLLTIPMIHDRAIVLIDGKRQGVLSRSVNINQLPVEARLGSRVDIIVENEGRINYGPYIGEKKGIIGDVTLNGRPILNWTHTYFTDMLHFLVTASNLEPTGGQQSPDELNTIDSIETDRASVCSSSSHVTPMYPALFRSSFQLANGLVPRDTFVNLSNFTKGVALLNGHLLGRYWPHTGPQVTLYVPGVWFKPYPDQNVLIVYETLGATSSFDESQKSQMVTIQFQEEHIINGTIPFSGKRIDDYWLNKFSSSQIEEEEKKIVEEKIISLIGRFQWETLNSEV